MTSRYSAAEPETRDAREIAEDLEHSYDYERDGFDSTLAYVSAYQNTLAMDYLDWRADGHASGTVRSDLPSFEAYRFGAQLFKAAHSVLLFAVLRHAYPDDRKVRYLGPPRSARWETERMPDVDDLREMFRSENGRKDLKRLAATMPHGLGQKGYERRVNALKEQAQENAEPGA